MKWYNSIAVVYFLRSVRKVKKKFPKRLYVYNLFGNFFLYLDYHNCIIRLARFRGKDKHEFFDNQQIDERGVVRVTFMSPILSGQKNGMINGMINDTEKMIYRRIISSPGISAVSLADEFDKSVRTIMRILKHLMELKIIEYRGPKKTGGYFGL